MSRLKVLVAAVVSVALLVPPLSATESYWSIFGGVALPKDIHATQHMVDSDEVAVNIELDHGFSLSGAYGYRLANGVRIEGQLGYLDVDTAAIALPAVEGGPLTSRADGLVSLTYGMVNMWVPIDTGTAIEPFVGGGVGYGEASIDSSYWLSTDPGGVNDSDSGFIWQVGVGADFRISDTTSVVARYRYLETDDFSVMDSERTPVSADFGTHLIDLGMRISF